jgi:general secretion pathway protein G
MHLRKSSAHSHRRNRRGFTLMELLVVVAILLVLAGSSILAYRTIFAESKMSVAKSTATNLKNQLEAYSMSPVSGMSYPANPADGFLELVQRGYLAKMPIDPWGQPYQWSLMPLPDGVSMTAVVWSCGPNTINENGGGDDITSE